MSIFDYYYGGESSQFSFCRIPRQLVTGEAFKGLSTDAKLLYALMLERMGLSARNGWYDEQGRVFIYYTVNEIRAVLNCGNDKAIKLLAELDIVKGINLIERVKQGQGKPTKIFVKNFSRQIVSQVFLSLNPNLICSYIISPWIGQLTVNIEIEKLFKIIGILKFDDMAIVQRLLQIHNLKCTQIDRRLTEQSGQLVLVNLSVNLL